MEKNEPVLLTLYISANAILILVLLLRFCVFPPKPPALEFIADPNGVISLGEPIESSYDPNIFWDTTLTEYDLSVSNLFDICFAVNNVVVEFRWDDGKFDVVYDANDLSGAAGTFFTYMLPYLNEHIEAKAEELKTVC